MSIAVKTRVFSPPEVNKKEILRYAGVPHCDPALSSCLDECLEEAMKKLVYRVSFCTLELKEGEDGVLSFPPFSVSSKDLSKNLRGCKHLIVFAATVGLEMDRLIARYSNLSPSKALWMQAIGSERVESLCDAFCRYLTEDAGLILRPRFSPGYGDLPLDLQIEIVRILDTAKNLGITLSEQLLLTPHKSVTAFVGICEDAAK